jgi:hypothetical protein
VDVGQLTCSLRDEEQPIALREIHAGRADEARHEEVRRALVQILRRRALLQPSLLECLPPARGW